MIDILHELGIRQPAICVKPIIYFNSRHISKIEGHYKTPAHQDWRSMQGSLNSAVVWIPLIDIDSNLGALEVIPGSHMKGLLPTERMNGSTTSDRIASMRRSLFLLKWKPATLLSLAHFWFIDLETTQQTRFVGPCIIVTMTRLSNLGSIGNLSIPIKFITLSSKSLVRISLQ